MVSEVTPEAAILNLGAATAEAVAKVLEAFVPDGVVRGEVNVVAKNESPFTNMPTDGVAASVRYVDGVTGANVFVMETQSVRTLAAAMGVPPEPDGAPLSEIEISAIGEAANQMLAAAAAAISVIIGQQMSISPPDVKILDEHADPLELWGTAPHACSTSFTVAGAPCRLIQLIPNAFVVRVARAISEQSSEAADHDVIATGSAMFGDSAHVHGSLGNVDLRVWAELGRTKMALGRALSLPPSAVIELDEPADNPVELYVNGLRFGQARLLVTDDGDWAVEVLSLGDPAKTTPQNESVQPNHVEISREDLDFGDTDAEALSASVSQH